MISFLCTKQMNSKIHLNVKFSARYDKRNMGIDMTECRLMKEGGRAHFMTRRFDRTPSADKIHMQSLCALGHYDFNHPGLYSYETALSTCQQLNLGQPSVAQLYRRMVFNVVALNQDDHTRNIAFLMDRDGQWRLAPAFDVIWSYNSQGTWTHRHQMTINGKTGGFTRQDLIEVANRFNIKKPLNILAAVGSAVRRWLEFAAAAGVSPERISTVSASHRLSLIP